MIDAEDYLVPARCVGMPSRRVASHKLRVVSAYTGRSALIVIHQSASIPGGADNHSCRACRARLNSQGAHGTPYVAFHCCRNDGVSATLVYKDERSAWERGRA